MSSLVIENPFRIQCWSNPSVLAYYWQEWLLRVVAEFVLRRTIHRSHLNPWVSAVSSQLMKKINTLEKRSDIPTAKILELKSQLNMNLDQDMCRYQEKMSLTRSSDRLFKVFRLLRQSMLPPVLRFGSSIATTDQDKATLFASFFQSVYNSSSEPYYQYTAEADIITTFELSETLIATLLQDLKANKATGPDGVPPLLLISLSQDLCHSCFRTSASSLLKQYGSDITSKVCL